MIAQNINTVNSYNQDYTQEAPQVEVPRVYTIFHFRKCCLNFSNTWRYKLKEKNKNSLPKTNVSETKSLNSQKKTQSSRPTNKHKLMTSNKWLKESIKKERSNSNSNTKET